VIVGIVQFCATIVSTFLLDRLGRRPLLLTSIAFMGVAMASLGGYYYYRDLVGVEEAEKLAWLPLASLVLYIIFYSIGIGPVPWFFIAELFPERARQFAGSMGVVSNLILAFVTLFLFSSFQR
jgi:MFS family permease